MHHQRHDRVSLEFGRRIAAGLESHPEWLDLARENIDRWSRQNHDTPGLLGCYSEWRQILDRPIGEIQAILRAQTDEGQRLRQNTPFVGILTPQEVWEIKRRIHETTSA